MLSQYHLIIPLIPPTANKTIRKFWVTASNNRHSDIPEIFKTIGGTVSLGESNSSIYHLANEFV